MSNKIKFFIVTFFLLLLFSCTKEDSKPTKPFAAIEKSSKRGIAYNLTDPADLDALKDGVYTHVMGRKYKCE